MRRQIYRLTGHERSHNITHTRHTTATQNNGIALQSARTLVLVIVLLCGFLVQIQRSDSLNSASSITVFMEMK